MGKAVSPNQMKPNTICYRSSFQGSISQTFVCHAHVLSRLCYIAGPFLVTSVFILVLFRVPKIMLVLIFSFSSRHQFPVSTGFCLVIQKNESRDCHRLPLHYITTTKFYKTRRLNIFKVQPQLGRSTFVITVVWRSEQLGIIFYLLR